jgi:hypothetical protein
MMTPAADRPEGRCLDQRPEAAHLRERFYALYDKISGEDILAHAYAQCRSNKGAPGMRRPLPQHLPREDLRDPAPCTCPSVAGAAISSNFPDDELAVLRPIPERRPP